MAEALKKENSKKYISLVLAILALIAAFGILICVNTTGTRGNRDYSVWNTMDIDNFSDYNILAEDLEKDFPLDLVTIAVASLITIVCIVFSKKGKDHIFMPIVFIILGIRAIGNIVPCFLTFRSPLGPYSINDLVVGNNIVYIYALQFIAFVVAAIWTIKATSKRIPILSLVFIILSEIAKIVSFFGTYYSDIITEDNTFIYNDLYIKLYYNYFTFEAAISLAFILITVAAMLYIRKRLIAMCKTKKISLIAKPISPKSQLQALNNQLANGEITEAEYNEKRAAIISKL